MGCAASDATLQLTEIELDPLDDVAPPPPGRRHRGDPLAIVLGIGALGLAIALIASAVGFVGSDEEAASSGETRGDGTVPRREPVPPALIAAESYVASPTADHLRALFRIVGGFEGLTLATTEGHVDLVTFDPQDRDVMMASMRDGYGPARNEAQNELWSVRDGAVARRTWRPDTPHDFVHYNRDGTITMWTLAGDGNEPYPHRWATTIDSAAGSTRTAVPLHPARVAVDGGTVFAIVISGDSYDYTDLVAVDHRGEVWLADASPLAWIDVPVTGLLIAHPVDAQTPMRLWDTASFEPIDDHPLLHHRLQRIAVSADGRRALGVDFEDRLVLIDPLSGDTLRRFGSLDPSGVQQPVTLNDDGSVAVTVDRDGRVVLWHTGEGVAIAATEADTGVLRWVSDLLSPRLSSAVAPDGERLALRRAATGRAPVTWSIIDTDVSSWLDRACELAGRRLSVQERADLGPPPGVTACG